jgi:membrane-bound lytic murein transglycosylase A
MTINQCLNRAHSRAGSLALMGLSCLILGLSTGLASRALANPAAPLAKLSPIGFQSLPGWQQEDFQGFWPAFLENCRIMRLRATPWARACRDAESVSSTTETIRQFLESRFTAFALTDASGARSSRITGYYEPLLRGSRVREGPFQTPLYRAPRDLVNVDLSSIYPELKALRLRGRLEGGRIVPYYTRAEIERQKLLAGQELLWVDDPIDAFFLQVQGSGRVQLPNGEIVRVGYAEQNGHPYQSIGRWLVDRGELALSEASMQGIKNWVARNPHRRDELLHQNPSMVFFKEINALNSNAGPPGSMGLPLTAERSLAVDPRFVVEGSLVFLDTRVPRPGVPAGDAGVRFQRLMIAQDKGSAILGAHRGDIFFGTGSAAGEVAGRMRADGTMYVVLPR